MSACAAQPSAAALADTSRPHPHSSGTPGDRGNNPSCGFISPPLPRSISPHPLRSRSIFRVTLGLRNGGARYGRCIVTPRYTPMPQTHQRQVRPTSLTSVQHFQHLQKNRREKLHAGGPGPGMLFLLQLPLRAGRRHGRAAPTGERILLVRQLPSMISST